MPQLLVIVLVLLSALECAQSTIERHRTFRKYYISAEELTWDYAPMKWDNLRDKPLTDTPAKLYTVKTPKRIGPVYHKALYRQYTSSTFKMLIAHDPALGTLGPVLRAEAGDQIRILFYNKASKPHSLHSHLNKVGNSSGASILPGSTYQYIWDIPLGLDFPDNQSSVFWTYASQANPIGDLNAGLIGPVVIYKPGSLYKPSPGSTFEKPHGIDQEIFTIMMTTDEGKSSYFLESLEEAGIGVDRLSVLQRDSLFNESNRMYHINSYVFNNNAELRLFYGHSVRWYVIAFGQTEKDIHTAHWHGATLLYHGHRVDVVDLMPVSFEVLDMVPDNEGQWMFHCHVAQHFDAGMTAFYEVEKLEYTGDEGWGK
ncbi:Cupredoxin [Spinellus fusiger]|nr:Cupredoxin [Spinellus fusiger]